jgi:multidrug efflux pump subunit AcrB
MILLFLGNWRLTLIILASIPLSIITAVLVMDIGGQTLNIMTLGGFALAVGILVDNATVVIENIERHVRLGEPLERAILKGAGEVGVPTSLATLCTCIVFVPVFLLQGNAKYLFAPLSISVLASLLASLALSFTLAPALFKYLMRSSVSAHRENPMRPDRPRPFNPFSAIHRNFEQGFGVFREGYRNGVAWAVSKPLWTVGFFLILVVASLMLFPALGRDFFPQVDAGQMQLHVRAPAGSRIEQTQADFARVETAIRDIVGNDQINTILAMLGSRGLRRMICSTSGIASSIDPV